MKKAILLLTSIFPIVSVSGQRLSPSDFMVNDQDTVIVIPPNSKIAYSGSGPTSSTQHNYFLQFYEDYSIYELSIIDSYSDMIFVLTISWGDYKVGDNKMYFHDRVAGFKMEASVEAGGIRFCEDYFPDIDKDVWEISPPESESDGVWPEFFAIFDNRKAERYREDYDRKYPEPFEFATGIYPGFFELEIDENGEWRQKRNDLMLAEGSWHRERNILVLHCPKLECDFYMTIEENKLVSMLLLGDFLGQYRFSKAELERLFSW